LNWYDTRTLEPKPPFFISSVDSGNLVASLWTLRQGCMDRLDQPLFSPAMAEGFLDHLRALADLRAFPKRQFSRCAEELNQEDWLMSILNFPDDVMSGMKSGADSASSSDAAWFRAEAISRLQNVRDMVKSYTPWKLPEFASLKKVLAGGASIGGDVSLQQLPDLIAEFEIRLDQFQSTLNGNASAAERLRLLLPQARVNALRLIENLRKIAKQANDLANGMDFSFLLDEKRLQLSVGFDAQSEELQPYFYDLLATEPRTAVFVAIAKEDIPQDCWFRLGRPCVSDHGRTVMLSWTGTMFEYLMPSLWLRNYPNTLLDRTSLAAVRSQQEFAASKGIPWGISESACARRNEAGDYHYEAFGVPNLALKRSESESLVVSPYSTFLSLNVDGKAALANLHRMNALGLFGSYGFLEAADYTPGRKRLFGPRFELVGSWMVHHQGMSLLSLANFLCDNVIQRWFHSDRRVRATELLLQERPVSRADAA
jgi:cyclic beta-1,2-glucan synthetase